MSQLTLQEFEEERKNAPWHREGAGHHSQVSTNDRNEWPTISLRREPWISYAYGAHRCSIWNRHSFTEKALPAPFKKISDKLLVLLSDVPHVSFTTDIWSSSVAPMSLLSLTAQWIDSSFVLCHATLHVQELRGSHTSTHPAIDGKDAKQLGNWQAMAPRNFAWQRWKYEESYVGVPIVGCVAHSCQLCVHQGLLSQKMMTMDGNSLWFLIYFFFFSCISWTCKSC